MTRQTKDIRGANNRRRRSDGAGQIDAADSACKWFKFKMFMFNILNKFDDSRTTHNIFLLPRGGSRGAQDPVPASPPGQAAPKVDVPHERRY